MKNKKGQMRVAWGGLDMVSAIIFVIGLLIYQSNNFIGGILIALGILKQFSGR